MKNICFKCIVLSILMILTATNVFADSEYTLGGSYKFNSQNTFSDASTLDIGITITGSILYDEENEFGFSLNYNVNWEEDTDNNVKSETSDLSPYLFYRRHFFISDEDSRFPLSVYVGPNIGMAEVLSPSGSSGFKFLAGLGVGLNLFLAKDVSLDILLFNANRIFKTNKTIIDQSLGIRFYF